MADQQHGARLLLGKADQRLGAGPGDTVPGPIRRLATMCLDRVDHRHRRRAAVARVAASVGWSPLPAAPGVGQAEPLGPEPDLGNRLLAGNVDGGMAGPRQRRQRLDQQRRLADTGVAADQHGGTRNEPAAGHPVELGNAALDALQGRLVALERHQAAGLPFGQARALGAGQRRRRGLLDQGIPFAAIVAAPGPFPDGRATGLADKAQLTFCHARLARSVSVPFWPCRGDCVKTGAGVVVTIPSCSQLIVRATDRRSGR
jgi:hypothetical protein